MTIAQRKRHFPKIGWCFSAKRWIFQKQPFSPKGMPPHKMHHRGFFPENGGNGMTELIFWLTVGILFCLGLVQVIGYEMCIRDRNKASCQHWYHWPR